MLSLTRARLAIAAAFLLVATSVLPAGPETQGYTDLKKERGDHGELVRALLNGETTGNPANQAHVKALDFEARWILYRIYDTTFHKQTPSDPKEPDPPKETITNVMKEYLGDINSLTREANRKGAASIYAKAIIERGTEVARAPGATQIAIANACRVLAVSAELGQPELADAFLPLIKDPPQHSQGAQYWSFRGLNDLLDKHPEGMTPERMAKVAETLSEFIEKPVTFPKEATEVDIAGYRVLRREAVRALGRTRIPAHDDKNLPALTLLKVMTGRGMQPAPDIDERVIAATGLARMRPGKDANYCPDYAVEHIGHVVADFASYMAADKSEKHRNGTGLPVKILSAQLTDELSRLRDSAKDPYVAGASKEIVVMLEKLESGGAPNPAPLLQWLEGNKAPNKQLFKDKTSSALEPKAPDAM